MATTDSAKCVVFDLVCCHPGPVPRRGRKRNVLRQRGGRVGVGKVCFRSDYARLSSGDGGEGTTTGTRRCQRFGYEGSKVRRDDGILLHVMPTPGHERRASYTL